MFQLTEEEGAIIAQALKILEKRTTGQQLVSPGAVEQWLRINFGHRPNEVFAILMLDNQHRVIALRELFQGTIDSCSVYPRVVLLECLQANAAACVLVHNHPSGAVEPSSADRNITAKLKTALELVDIRVIDHMVVGSHEVYSFANHGLL